MRQSLRDLVERLAKVLPIEAPVLEFGSYQVQSARVADLRPFFEGVEYIGLDSRPGPGVDQIADVMATGLDDDSAGVILCLETLEHVTDPRAAVAELYRVLAPGGWMLVTSVLNWPIHNEPSDYWRFTPAGFGLLFDRSAIIVWSGHVEYPHSVLALAWKGKLDADLVEAKAILDEWCRVHRDAP